MRIDSLHILPDLDSIDMNPFADCQVPPGDPDIYKVDGRWAFNDGDETNAVGRSWQWQQYVDYIDTFFFQEGTDWGLVHELAHQIGVIDIYRMNLLNQTPCDVEGGNWGVGIRDKNGAIIDARVLPT